MKQLQKLFTLVVLFCLAAVGRVNAYTVNGDVITTTSAGEIAADISIWSSAKQYYFSGMVSISGPVNENDIRTLLQNTYNNTSVGLLNLKDATGLTAEQLVTIAKDYPSLSTIYMEDSDEGIIISNKNGGLTQYQHNGIFDKKKIKVYGTIGASDNKMFQGFTKIDLSNVTSADLTNINFAQTKVIILPKDYDIPDKSKLCNYGDDKVVVLAPSSDGSLEVKTFAEGMLSYIENDSFLDNYAPITLNSESVTNDADKAIAADWPTTGGDGGTSADLEVNLTSGETIAKITDFLATDGNKIKKLTVIGEMSDLSALDGVEAKSVDLSGVTNTNDISTLKLPTTTGEIIMPGGLTYKGKKVTNTTGMTIEKVAQELKALAVTNSKEITSVELSGGSTWSNGTLTLASEANLADIVSALTGAGLSVNTINFASGTIYSNGNLNVAAADDTNDGLKAIADALTAANLTVTKVALSDGTTWSDKTMTYYSSLSDVEKTADENKLKNAGFEVETSEAQTAQVLGDYVKIVDGVVVVTTTAEGQLNGSLNNDEWDAVNTATSLKLVGPYSDNDFLKLQGINGPTSLDLTDAIISNDQVLKGNLKKNLVTLKLPEDPNYTSVATQFCNGVETLATLILPDNIKTIGNAAFQSAKALQSVTLPSHLKYIDTDAFNGTGLTSISIPGSVKMIKTQAFINCDQLTQVVFEELLDENGNSIVDMTIEKLAFRQADKIWDVYIETLGNLSCENDAFDFATTYGHGDASATTATLHFPESKIEEYCNLRHVLTYQVASDPGLFNRWLLEHYNNASQEPKNGWWEFVNNGATPDDPGKEDVISDPNGVFLKTYSFYADDVEVEETDGTKKTYPVAKLVPQGVKAYIVNGVQKDENGNYRVSLKQLYAIPSGTGVILYGEGNSRTKTDQIILAMNNTVAFDGLPLRRDYWSQTLKEENGELVIDRELCNMLMPTAVDREGNEVTGKLHIEPWEADEKGKVLFRNFNLANFKSTDSYKRYIATYKTTPDNFIGFFRAKRGDYNPGKAYLHMAADEYDFPEGMESIVVKDENYKNEYDKNGALITGDTGYWHNAVWETDWGVRNLDNAFKAKFVGEPIFEEEDGTATLIVPAEVVHGSKTGVYYNLQGQKVNRPAKGIFIQNGKKVIIK